MSCDLICRTFVDVLSALSPSITDNSVFQDCIPRPFFILCINSSEKAVFFLEAFVHIVTLKKIM